MHIMSLLSPMRNSQTQRSRILFLALLGIATCSLSAQSLTVWSCLQAGNSCTPNDSQIAGYPISSGAVTTIAPLTFGQYQPQMPHLDITDNQLGCSDSADVVLNVSYLGPQDTYFPNAYSTAGTWEGWFPSGGDWLIDWTYDLESNYPIEGGSAQFFVSVDDGPYVPDMSFSIQGTSPTKPNTLSYAAQSNAPWFYTGIMKHESGDNQFYNQGVPGGWTFGPGTGHPCSYDPSNNVNTYTEGGPVFGCPDGYGIAQMDGASGQLRDADLWDWTANISDGISLAWGYQATGYDRYNAQISAMMFYENSIHNGQCTASHTSKCIFPPSVTWGSCSFSYAGAGSSNLEDASWIVAYNTGGSNTVYKWISGSNNSDGSWVLTKASTYAKGVCASM